MKITLFGYYGFNNVGDEQLLDETIRLLKEIDPLLNFTVANGPCPAPYTTFNRWHLFDLFKHLYQSSHIIFGGGSLFQSKTSFLSLCYYLFILCLARIFNCRVILLCQGWGPFKYSWHEKFALLFVNYRFNCRCWRQPFELMSKNDKVFCDLVLTQSFTQCTRPVVSNKVGINLNSSSSTTYFKDYCSNINVPFCLISNQKPKAHYQMLQDHWDDNQLNIKFLITDRYHSAIWASRNGIPWCAISSDPKLIYLSEVSNQTCVNSISEVRILDQIHQDDALIHWVESYGHYRESIRSWLREALNI